jgi:hypothetical protein
LIEWHRDETRPDEEEEPFPERVRLQEPALSLLIYQLMEATGWKFAPSVLLNEPDWLLQDLLKITSLSNKVRKELHPNG